MTNYQEKIIDVLNSLRIRCTNSASNYEILRAKKVDEALDYAIRKIKEEQNNE